MTFGAWKSCTHRHSLVLVVGGAAAASSSSVVVVVVVGSLPQTGIAKDMTAGIGIIRNDDWFFATKSTGLLLYQQ